MPKRKNWTVGKNRKCKNKMKIQRKYECIIRMVCICVEMIKKIETKIRRNYY
jgi:hypothetical protein